jgi:hypothetical protein
LRRGFHHSIVREEGDNAPPASTARTEQGIDLIDLADHLGPAFGRDGPELVLYNPERASLRARLADLASMSIGVEVVIKYCDLSLVGNMGSDSGDELQVTRRTAINYI